jgi:hypothetical protein
MLDSDTVVDQGSPDVVNKGDDRGKIGSSRAKSIGYLCRFVVAAKGGEPPNVGYVIANLAGDFPHTIL